MIWVQPHYISSNEISANEPNNQNNEDAVHIIGVIGGHIIGNLGYWNDQSIDDTFRFVCNLGVTGKFISCHLNQLRIEISLV